MIEKYLAPGYKIEMRHATRHVKQREGEETQQVPKTYISQIYDVVSDDTVEVLMPIEQSKITLLPLNAVYTLVVYTPTGVYQCDAKVAERYKKDKIYLNKMKLVSSIKKYQRREYYRHNCSIPIFSRKLEQHEIDEHLWDVEKEGTEGETLDISGGGVRFITRDHYESGDTILCSFELPLKIDTEEYHIMGKVLSVAVAGKYENRQEVRVQFEGVTSVIRDEIIEFIFEDERRQRRKGKRR